MKFKWQIDEATTVEARFRPFVKQRISVNDKEVLSQRRKRAKGKIDFTLPDGRPALIDVRPQFIGKSNPELRIDGRLFAPSGKDPFKCEACGAIAKPYDRFCTGCGKNLPTPEQLAQKRQVKEATNAMRILAWVFAIFGVVMFFAVRSQVDNALNQIAGMDDGATIPLEGVTYTVGQLREQLRWEPWSMLWTNLILAAVMAGLAFWGKRSPLPALVIAMGTYAVVLVTNAIIDPKTIPQGIFLKIIVIGLFVKGLKAALALRAADG